MCLARLLNASNACTAQQSMSSKSSNSKSSFDDYDQQRRGSKSSKSNKSSFDDYDQQRRGSKSSKSNKSSFDECDQQRRRSNSSKSKSSFDEYDTSHIKNGLKHQLSFGFNSSSKLIELVDMHTRQGKKYYASGDYEKSLELFSKALNEAPMDWPGQSVNHGYRSATLVMLNRFVEAVEDCNDALKLDPSALKLCVRKAKCLIKLGNFDAADEVYEYLMDVESEDVVNAPPEGTDTKEEQEQYEKQLQNMDEQIELNKYEAHVGVKEVATLRGLMTNLYEAEDDLAYTEALKLSQEILAKSPYCQEAILSKANALCELGSYDDAKHFIEDTTATTHETIREVFSHLLAPSVFPSPASLVWRQLGVLGNLANASKVDTETVVQSMLSMGSELAQIYMVTLKNMEVNRACSTDIMKKLLDLLNSLLKHLSPDDLVEVWSWVALELVKLKNLIAYKSSADTHLAKKTYKGALMNYGDALRTDFSATKWNAVLFTSRATAFLEQNQPMDALSDCYEAINLDSSYSHAYLIRARSNVLLDQHHSVEKWHEVMHDYKTYLSFDPVPSDAKEVKVEMEAFDGIKRQQYTAWMEMYQQCQEKYEQFQQQKTEVNESSSGPTTDGNENKNENSAEKNRRHSRDTAGSSFRDTFKRADSANAKFQNGQRVSQRLPRSCSGTGTNKAPSPMSNSTATPPPKQGSPPKPSSSNSRSASRDHLDTSYSFAGIPVPPPKPSSSGRAASRDHDTSYSFSSVGGNPFAREQFERPDGWTRPDGPGPDGSRQSSGSTCQNNSKGDSRKSSRDDSSTFTGKSIGGRPKPPPPPRSTAAGSSTSTGTGTGTSTGEENKTPPPIDNTPCDHYTMLGLGQAATDRDIKLAYRKLALKIHPDKNKAQGAEEKFKSINLAHSVLSDKASRREYDLSLKAKGWKP